MEQQQHRALTASAVADLVAVDRDVFDCECLVGCVLIHGVDRSVVRANRLSLERRYAHASIISG